LKTWNQLKNDNAVLGQRLRLTAPENVNPKKASSQETSIKTTQVTKTEKTETKVVAKTHKVKVGDSLSSIATKYGVSAQAIKDLNKLKDDNVVLDKTLKIPTP
ncbi:MAG TPA: LysM peptidoglycan-binding domain-containing protein, partial [Agitococcus sp.]|nr:LysM peptidoglycan-binding domain-containing protein [Agitococcus sp.]